MKILKIAFIIFLAIFTISVIAAIVFLYTFDLNKFKGQIVSEISKSLGREVGAQDISADISFKHGIVIDVNNFYIKDHPDFSTTDLFFTDSIYLDVDLMEYVKSQKIAVDKIEIKDPRFNFIVNKDGQTNIEKLLSPDKKDKAGESPAQKSSEKTDEAPQTTSPKKKEGALPNLFVETIQITDGYFNYIDRSSEQETSVPVKGIDLHVSNLSFTEPFEFVFRCSLWSPNKNIQFNGLAQVNEAAKQVRVDDLTSSVFLSDFSFEQINESIPDFTNAGLEKELQGEIKLNLDQMIVGEEGLLVLSLNGQVVGGEVKLKALEAPIQNIRSKFEVSESNFVLEDLKMDLASGLIVLTGRLNDYLKEQTYSYNKRIDNINLNQIVPKDIPVEVQGKLNGVFNAQGKGFTEAAVQQNLNGDGELSVVEGRLVDVNLLKLVLDKISFIPNLSQKVEANLPEKYKSVLNQKDTELTKVEFKTNIKEGLIHLNQIDLAAEGFLLQANGQMDFNQNINLNAGFYIEEDLSNSLIAAEETLSALVNDKGQIQIPLKPYNGPLDKFVIYPDIKDFTKTIYQNKGKQELKKVLYKALDLDDDPAPEGEEGQSQTTDEPKEQKPEEVLIENLLEAIPLFN